MSELNSKWWYRLVKVIFIIIFLTSVIFTAYFTFDSNKTRTVSDYIVKCNYGNKTTFASWEEKKIYMSSYDLRNDLSSLSDNQKNDIQKACEITQEELNKIFDKIRASENIRKLFEISSGKIEVESNLKALFYSFLSILGLCLAFEVVRRVFYYILFGKVFPNK